MQPSLFLLQLPKVSFKNQQISFPSEVMTFLFLATERVLEKKATMYAIHRDKTKPTRVTEISILIFRVAKKKKKNQNIRTVDSSLHQWWSHLDL